MEDFTIKKTVSASECSRNVEVGVLGAVSGAEDAFTWFMLEREMDAISLKKKYNAMWVFTKNRVVFKKTLFWNDEFTLRCFCSGKSLVRATMDIEFINQKGEVCILSQIEACVLDISTGRIKKLSEIDFDKIEKNPSKNTEKSGKIVVNEPISLYRRKVLYTNIDYNNHTNNKEYIRFILDSFDEKEQSQKISCLEIEYVSQSRLYDELDILAKKEKLTKLYEIRHNDDICVKCKIEFLG